MQTTGQSTISLLDLAHLPTSPWAKTFTSFLHWLDLWKFMMTFQTTTYIPSHEASQLFVLPSFSDIHWFINPQFVCQFTKFNWLPKLHNVEQPSKCSLLVYNNQLIKTTNILKLVGDFNPFETHESILNHFPRLVYIEVVVKLYPSQQHIPKSISIQQHSDMHIYIHTSDNTCPFSDTVPASLHSHLWFEGFGYRHIRYRLAVSTWEALEP